MLKDHRRWFEWGGYAAAIVLVAFGIVTLVMAVNGRNTVNDNLRLEAIVGSADMTPAQIRDEASKAGLKDVALPTCDVADEKIETGEEARCFAQYMRIHTL